MTPLILIWLSAGAMFLGFAIGSFAGWLHERRSENNRRKREAQRLANLDFGGYIRRVTDSIKHEDVLYADGDSIIYKKPRSSDSLD